MGKVLENFIVSELRKQLTGFVIYTGATIVPFGENLFAIPISMLWA